MTTSDTRVRGIGEMIAVLPHQLGYHPRSSLVVICLHSEREDGRPRSGSIGLTARSDLPPYGAEEPLLDHLLDVLSRQRPHVVELIAFEEEDDDATELLERLSDGCRALGIAVDNEVRVRAGRYLRSFEPDGSRPQWREVPEPLDVPATAEMVYQGLAPVGEREDLERMLEGNGVVTHPAVEAMFFERLDRGWPLGAADHRARAAAVWARALAAGEDPRAVEDLSAEEITDLLLSLLDIEFRDCLLATLAPADFALPELSRELIEELQRELGGVLEDGPLLIGRLAALVRRTPYELSAPVVTLLGVVSWTQGEGTLANIAAERALAVLPDYQLAGLLDLALARAVPPRRGTRSREPGTARTGPHEGVA